MLYFFIVLVQTIMLSFSLPSHFFINGLIFICFVPAFIVKDKFSLYSFSLIGGLMGFFAGFFIYYGVISYSFTIYLYSVIITAIEAFYFFYFIKRFSFLSGFLFLVLIEFWRTIGPLAFPSCFSLGMYKMPVFINIARYGGIYLCTFFALIINYLIYCVITKQKKIKYIFLTVLSLFIASVPYFYYEKIYDNENALNIAIIQGTKPARFFPDSMDEDEIEEYTFNSYKKMIDTASRSNVDFIFVPETSFIRNLEKEDGVDVKKFLLEITNKNDVGIFTGGIGFKNGRNTNTLFYIDNNKILDDYNKIRLVPITETDFYKAGVLYKSLGGEALRVVPAICYESIFERILFKNNNPESDTIYIASSDLQYSSKTINYLHAAFAVFRAVEMNKYVVRATHSGISMVVDNLGRVINKGKFYEPEIIYSKIKKIREKTFFEKYYNAVIFFYFTVFIFDIFRCYRKNRSSNI